MKKIRFAALIIPFILLSGCGNSYASDTSNAAVEPSFSTVQTNAVETTSTSSSIVTQSTTNATSESIEQTITEATIANDLPKTETVQSVKEQVESEDTTVEESEATTEETVNYEVFSGILIDDDCSDFESPPEHDLPCMLMDSCRASGYGIDIQLEDGSWKFYMFDEKGQELSWDYLTHTKRMNKLYVTVTGILENDIIYVEKLEEK